MAGMNFQYDETGGTFYYFLVSFYALALIPFTFWVFRRKDEKDTKDKDKAICHCEACQTKHRRLSASKPKHRIIQRVLYIVVVVAWIFFAVAAYKVSLIKTDHVEYNPYEVLGIDHGASDKEIRKQYRDLSKLHHPDKSGGDDTMFLRIAKAYAALTDAESRKNWEEYGNPDGPGAMQFGIALPKWLVEGNTSLWVLMTYIVVFMVILPFVVGTWWYKSIKYNGDKILVPTQQLFMYFINKTPNMIFKRALMVLGASFEFSKKHNQEIVERPSDDAEVHQVMRALSSSHLNEKNKENPLCYPYSIKARALLLAHMQRLQLHEPNLLPANTLQKDLRYLLEKCPLLINEMVQSCAQLVAWSKMGQAHKPRLETVENIMKISPLLVQGLWENSSQLLMLPHVSEQQLKYFTSNKRPVRNCKQLCQLSDEERRALFRHTEDQEYRNIMTVLKSLPAVTMQCDMKVLDDEDVSITANAIVTVAVKLTRESMLDKFGSGLSSLDSDEKVEAMGSSEMGQDADDDSAEDGEEKAEVEEKKKSSKVWEKNKGKKSKTTKKKKSGMTFKTKKKPVAGANHTAASGDDDENGADNEAKPEEKTKEDGEDDSENENENEDGNENENESEAEMANGDVKSLPSSGEEEEEDWEELDAENKKSNKLEMTSLVSHTVHSPYFPTEKQEYWWLYLCDRKRSELITIPVRITNLVDREEVAVKFPAPRKPGVYTYTMCLKSDSYIDMDISLNLKFDVKEAKVIENHPQWDISDDEEDRDLDDGEKEEMESDDDSEYEYEDDSE